VRDQQLVTELFDMSIQAREIANQVEKLAAGLVAVAGTEPTAVLVEVYDIVTLWEVATELGIDKRVVERWSERRASTQFPEPLKRLHYINLYSRSAVFGWHTDYLATRRPRTTK
jgi:hypothetical protein